MPVWLQNALQDNRAVRKLDQNKSPLPVQSLIQEALVLAASYRHNPRPLLVIKQNLYNAQRLYEKVSVLLSEDECALFSADESLRVEAIASSPEMTAVKVETMASLLKNPNQLVITCPSAMLRHLPFPEDFRKGCIHLQVDMDMKMNEIREKLIAGGYQQTSHIDQPLTFAVRGGIVDVYSINYENPIRIEFFDTVIDSIRFFDISTQKTIESINEAEIVPASEVIFTDAQVSEISAAAHEIVKGIDNPAIAGVIESDIAAMEQHVFEHSMYNYMALLKQTAGIWHYMDHPTIILSDEESVRENVKRLNEDTIIYIQEMVQEGKMLPKYAVWHELDRAAMGCKRIKVDPFADNISDIAELHLTNESFENRMRMIDRSKKNVLALSEKEFERAAETCVALQIPYHLMTENTEPDTGINLYLSDFNQGFRINDLYVYTSNELLEVQHHRGRYDNKFRNAEVIHGYEELQPGDYVVHATYGVGQYLNIENREVQGVKRDFLKIVYRGNAELLVPLEQFRLVRKFVSREGVVPRLNKLGSGEWEKTKKKLQANVENIAGRLIDLYSNRETHIGHAFKPDTEMSRRFENEFPHELTPDQKQAVIDIKKDMESSKPMDRLVCGDVGFGKTEVSVIASFKAVADGKQVAVLCPTTILAEQHFKTYRNRYKGYPVTIRVLDRFVPDPLVKQTLKDLEEGRVDILIGTHRILSKDVVFKDLGLLIVDEEQRFGVEHKEKIKEMKNGIDVLSLSATPIPRTLQMSLVGIRQLSQLETPPLNRYSVQTYVVEKNKGLIIDAIQKELAREGQVFYLHNNVQEMYNVARNLQSWLPEARVGVVNGQMNRDEIEDNMKRFSDHEIDIMVCTTIVENGIDIPNVNTILIENAQDFGLAQIYQIKGRVGRSDRVAYAYLMIPPRRQLSEVAQKRLTAVKEFAKLGSGYKIAMRDLTIRGAGDLLGPSQSGFIDTVGIDMYVEMLEAAIKAKQEGTEIKTTEPTAHANIGKTSYIPENFASDDYDKLAMYQKIDAVASTQELSDYQEDVIDQYGRLPREVSALFQKKELDLLLSDPMVQSYREQKMFTDITLSAEYSDTVDGVKLFEMCSKITKDINMRYTNKCIIIRIPKRKDDLEIAIKAVQAAREAKRQ